jgi:hypothetical protein
MTGIPIGELKRLRPGEEFSFTGRSGEPRQGVAAVFLKKNNQLVITTGERIGPELGYYGKVFVEGKPKEYFNVPPDFYELLRNNKLLGNAITDFRPGDYVLVLVKNHVLGSWNGNVKVALITLCDPVNNLARTIGGHVIEPNDMFVAKSGFQELEAMNMVSSAGTRQLGDQSETF